MQISGRKLEIEPADLAEISKAQDRAVDMINKHLAEPLKKLEAMGYTRLEFACAYLSLAYHALRFKRTKEQADKNFPILAYLACKRVEEDMRKHRAKKLH